MSRKICPNCGYELHYESKNNFIAKSTYQPGSIDIFSPKFQSMYICKKCGYIEYIHEE